MQTRKLGRDGPDVGAIALGCMSFAGFYGATSVAESHQTLARAVKPGIIEACKRLGTAFVPFSPLARGMLSDVEPIPATFTERDLRATNPRFQEPNLSANLKRINRFKAYAHNKGATPASLALACVLHRGDHLIPIPGTRSLAHLEYNTKAASMKLSASEMAEIETVLPAGFAHGDRYSDTQMNGVERYC
jgi:aryl-alcohol dehydrogenase-like predicted oxidoreductase